MSDNVYVVCEYPHGVEDEVHRIVLVTADRAVAEGKAFYSASLFVMAYPLIVADDIEPPGAGADPAGRPDPRTHPEFWTE